MVISKIVREPSAAQLTLPIYCWNDFMLLAPCGSNTLTLTAMKDFEGLFYEALCKTAARQHPVC
jgi:hypothetical protein